MGGHLAIIPDADIQNFILTKGIEYKRAGKWMTSKNNAWIDAVKTSDGTGWEWSTTHDKFYFKTTPLGLGGSNIQNGKYNNWHPHYPRSTYENAVVGSNHESYPWSWQSVTASTEAHYICQIKAQVEYYKGSYFMFSVTIKNHAGAKSACNQAGGHLAIIPDLQTQIFIQTKAAAFKKEGKWMTSNINAYIDAVMTSDGTGWEWSTTHDKFYFNTTKRGVKGN
uniref:uncharacterized protein LOC113474253 n=1 Tax=Ciona intestinalis TaxID=7719 RepID=UPI000EF45B7D|nr:uncharacterized protein LOC113474253 [Ciona intestinalis]|eukprot:XP_026690429.1 uncharacterized protein LOC113474253 [Ciona intestinalis]